MTERPTRGFGGLLARPNLPYLLAFTLAVSATAAFLLLHGIDPDSTVAGEQATTTTQDVGSGTTVTTESTTTTEAGGTSTSSTDATTTTAGDGTLQALSLEILATDIPQPTFAAALPGTDSLVVLERQGRAVLVEPDGGIAPDPYLDLLDRVGASGIENGLLGLAFHPGFAENGRLFVYYTDADLDTRLSEFTADPAATTVDASTEQILLEYDQEGIRHRGGMLQFGPDGHLYVAIGDGGLGDRAAQDTGTVLGTISRIDVDGDTPYAIPPGNPFADGGEGAPELWLWGLRNPWRFAIDATDGLIYIADVGQENWEEIDVYSIEGEGADFGWPDFEGTHCYLPEESCDQTGWVEPVYEYSHEEGCAVTGGYVYRGAALPELDGHYFFADWCSGWVRSFAYSDGGIGDVTEWAGDMADIGQVASFGLDADGELLVVTSEGTVARIIGVR